VTLKKRIEKLEAKAPPKAEWPADNIERRKVSALIPYARNARTHSDAQVAQIAASIREWGWTNPVLIDAEGGLIAGHGRVLAARKLGIEDVPCMVATGWSDAQKRAYILADNQLALNGGWDTEFLKVELGELAAENFNVGLIGFDPEWLGDIFDDTSIEGLSENYTRKIEAPIYTPKGDKPAESELYDGAKAAQLKAEITAAELPEKVRAFLMAAADRHTVFRFDRIAEYYCHASPAVQNLMERSALVVIDFDKAVELGFVKLAAAMMAKAEESKARNYAA
jgi:hypothetical protein